MQLFTIAGYFIVAFIIHAVLTKLAEKNSRLTGKMERGIFALALIWPLWGEFALIAFVGYGLIKGLQSVNSSEPKRT